MMHFGGSSVPGPRPYNEDAFLTRDLSEYSDRLGGIVGFIMVSDGMGGHEGGDVASATAIAAANSYIDDLVDLASRSVLSLDPAQAVREIASEAHEAVLKASVERGARSMGATFVGALVSTDHAWIGHIGDSRAYLLSNGTASAVTVDHSQVGRMLAEGSLTEEQAQHHPSRNVIERALGFEGATADVTELAIDRGDALLLCSDGVSTVLSAEDMYSVVNAASDPTGAAADITASALKARTDDNATAVVWAPSWSSLRAGAGTIGRRRSRKTNREHSRAQRMTGVMMAAGGLVIAGLLAVALGTPPSGGMVVPSAASAEATGQAVANPPKHSKYDDPVADPFSKTAFNTKRIAKPKDEVKDGVIQMRIGPGNAYRSAGELRTGTAVVKAHAKRTGFMNGWYVVDSSSISKSEVVSKINAVGDYDVVYIWHKSLESLPAPKPAATPTPRPVRRYTAPSRRTRKEPVKRPTPPSADNNF